MKIDKNYGRYNLVTRFKCSKCGSQLSLSYTKDDNIKVYPNYVSDGMTGADKVESDIWIEPCETCVESPQKELDTLRRILKG